MRDDLDMVTLARPGALTLAEAANQPGDLTLAPELRGRYPRLASYLAALPAGLGSYPECKVRIGTYDSVLGPADTNLRWDDLDDRVRRFLGSPPRGLWVPEVDLLAGILAIGDHYHLTPQQHYEWLLVRNRLMFRGTVYRALMAFLSPDQLLRKAADRWGNFHQGTQVRSERTAVNKGVLDLTFPPNLFDPAAAYLFGAVFTAALERANATSVKFTLREVTSTCARFDAEWH